MPKQNERNHVAETFPMYRSLYLGHLEKHYFTAETRLLIKTIPEYNFTFVRKKPFRAFLATKAPLNIPEIEV